MPRVTGLSGRLCNKLERWRSLLVGASLIEPRILYVTSFEKSMYEATGRRLISSFCALEPEGDLLVCPENCSPLIPHGKASKVTCSPLDNSSVLRNWLKCNHDVIPQMLGGGSAPCACIAPDDPSPLLPCKGLCLTSEFNGNVFTLVQEIVALAFSYAHSTIAISDLARFGLLLYSTLLTEA